MDGRVAKPERRWDCRRGTPRFLRVLRWNSASLTYVCRLVQLWQKLSKHVSRC